MVIKGFVLSTSRSNGAHQLIVASDSINIALLLSARQGSIVPLP